MKINTKEVAAKVTEMMVAAELHSTCVEGFPIDFSDARAAASIFSEEARAVVASCGDEGLVSRLPSLDCRRRFRGWNDLCDWLGQVESEIHALLRPAI